MTMRNFKIVLGFELKEYFKSKGFMITTLLIAILAIVGLSLPRFIDFGLNRGMDGAVSNMFKTEDHSTIKFCIRDTGIGMDQAFIPKIFDTFTQEDSSRNNRYGSNRGLKCPASGLYAREDLILRMRANIL